MSPMKRLKRLATCLLAAAALALTACAGLEPAPQPAEANLFAMDTYMTLVAFGDGAEDALTRAAQTINQLDATLSRTREGSDVWNLNRDGSASVGPDTAALVDASLRYAADTGGCFDVTVAPLVEAWGITTDSPRVPSQTEIDGLLKLVGSQHLLRQNDLVTLDRGCAIDFGAIAKGYASDAVAAVLTEAGVDSATVSLGGNVYVRGTRPDGEPWSVAVQDPASDGFACTLTLSDAFAVTSGGYQRYFTADDGTLYQHIIDPRTGWPADSDLLSATVICDNGTRADAYSTALYVMGEKQAWQFWESHENGERTFDMVLITADGRIVCTPGLAGAVTVEKGSSYELQLITH